MVAINPNDAVKRKTDQTAMMYRQICVHFHVILRSSWIYNSFSINYRSLHKLARNFLKVGSNGLKRVRSVLKLDTKCLKSDFGRNVLSPKCPLLWYGFRRNVLLVTQSTITRPVITKSNRAETCSSNRNIPNSSANSVNQTSDVTRWIS